MSPESLGPDPDGATPLTEEDIEGLLPQWVSNRDDLNLAEAHNIADAIDTYFAKEFTTGQLVDDLFARQLHKAMYRHVWSWAGAYRPVETSIGVAPERIAVDVVNLMADTQYWLNLDQPELIDNAVCEIHHRLVQIHPFRNGNGRMSRLFADLLLMSKGQDPFSWGGGNLDVITPTRTSYIAALRAADAGDLSALRSFVRATDA